jgi:CheY-like chemotaxis protein
MKRPARILLVDDEPSIQKGPTPLLASRGYEVQSATTGQAALKALKRPLPPDRADLDCPTSGRRSVPARAHHLAGANHRPLRSRCRCRPVPH